MDTQHITKISHHLLRSAFNGLAVVGLILLAVLSIVLALLSLYIIKL